MRFVEKVYIRICVTAVLNTKIVRHASQPATAVREVFAAMGSGKLHQKASGIDEKWKALTALAD